VGVEKGALGGIGLRLRVLLWDEYFLVGLLQLSHHSLYWSWSLAQEADQSLDVLGSGCQEELLPNKLHPA
jgi:hypothetical protein